MSTTTASSPVDNVQDSLQFRIDQLANLCNQYYSTLPAQSKPNKKAVMELIKWVSQTANNLNRDDVDAIRDRFFLITAEHGHRPILDQIRDSLIVIKGMQPKKMSSGISSLSNLTRPSTSNTSLLRNLTSKPVTYNPSLLGSPVSDTELVRLTGPQPKITNIADMVKGLRDGSIPPPKISFNQPRIVTIINSEQFTPAMMIRAANDEIDTLRLGNRMFIVEPSMEPVTMLMWEKLKVNGKSEDKIQLEVEQYRTALVSILEEDTDKEIIQIYDDALDKIKKVELKTNIIDEIKKHTIRIGQGPFDYTDDDVTTIPIHNHSISNLVAVVKPHLDIEVHKRLSEYVKATNMSDLLPFTITNYLNIALINILIEMNLR